jgi:DHA2 family multidrug resistance protein
MKPKGGSRLLITIAVMSATVMQVLDTTIVNVVLPQMQGGRRP